ncbi:MAG: ABC transporter permease [Arenicellales bacterium]|jgi:peptide/nickel transport system permease protein|nr:ABC transporter permease [Arenicellales bacterium]HJL66362.1 ABC transporter permease [Arenicellales bacterium]HJP27134.1 ABC transporter permease [Arenicellales bacterium]|tara:strand:+ start:3019 stop:3936 length:918 start_codon:yes stop_codon:yes gene_type:complete
MNFSLERMRRSPVYYSFINNKVAMVSAAILSTLLLVSILAPFIAPYDPWDQTAFDIMDSEYPPIGSSGADDRFLLGTDDMGRDMLSTILYGTGISIAIGIFATILQAFMGISIGLVSGYFGSRLDSFLMRIADIQLSFTTLMVAIIILAVFQAAVGLNSYERYALLMIVLVIGIAEWPQYARTVRACVLAEKKKEYVDAVKVIGLRPMRILYRHILPNTFSPLLVISTVQVANAIITEAGLSFLGLGMPITKPSLGSLIRNGFDYIFSGSWWITFLPALVLIVLILTINLLGDWLRDVLNPKIYK